MTVEALLVGYCVLIVIASVAGGRLSSLLRMTHLRTQLLMSFVGGLMLGIATLHLLPHATATLGSSGKAGAGALVGVVAMFLLMRMFHPHQHDATMPLPEGGALPCGGAVGGEVSRGDGEGRSGVAEDVEGKGGEPGEEARREHADEHGYGHEHPKSAGGTEIARPGAVGGWGGSGWCLGWGCTR